MKRIKKIIIAAFSVLIAVSIVGCSNNGANKSSQKADPNQFRREYKEKFDKVKIGSYGSGDAEGTTIKEATDILGKPNTTSTSKSPGTKIKSYTWKKKKMEIYISFIKDKAVMKIIGGLDWKRDKKITVKDFDAVKDKSSYKSVVKKLGEPDGVTESRGLEKKYVGIIYNLDTPKTKEKKQTIGSFAFTNDVLMTKKRTAK